jgi:molybdenum cofactor cytidylyltransferase
LIKEKSIAIVLLAAGSSTRMGGNKLVLKAGKKSLLENAVESALGSMADNVVVVLGANRPENERIIKEYSVIRVVNDGWPRGVGSSIKTGVRKVMDLFPRTDAIIISVCDQPHLSAALFDDMIKRYVTGRKPVVASEYAGTIGVPVLYDKTMFGSLMSIGDEHGAKKHLLANVASEDMETIPFPGGELDIDTKEDMENLY